MAQPTYKLFETDPFLQLPTAVNVGFQSLGLVRCFLPSPKAGTLEPAVGLQSWVSVVIKPNTLNIPKPCQ